MQYVHGAIKIGLRGTDRITGSSQYGRGLNFIKTVGIGTERYLFRSMQSKINLEKLQICADNMLILPNVENNNPRVHIDEQDNDREHGNENVNAIQDFNAKSFYHVHSSS